MKLYGARMSANARRVKVYLIEKGISLEQVDFEIPYSEMNTEAFAQKSPTLRIPVLELDDGSSIVESIAIIEYLEELYPEPNMLGATPEERAFTRMMSSIVTDLVLPIGTYVRHRGVDPGFLESRGLRRYPEMAEFFLGTVNRGLGAFETLMGDNEFLTGNRPMIPDCHAYAILQACVEKFDYEFTDRVPRLAAWYERFSTRPSAPM